jgi:hypothetical protein
MTTRLTLPMRFNSEKRALGAIRDNGLFSMGAVAVELPGTGGGRWRIVIDTGKPDAVARYLSQSMTPGVEWQRSELPA